MKISQLVIVAVLSCSFATVSPAKEGKGQGNSKKEEKAAKHAEKHGNSEEKGSKGPDSHKDGKTAAISKRERDVLHEYVHARNGAPNSSLPPGLAKKVARGKALPPGWQKKMVVGQVCPPDIFEVCQPLPKDLIIKLPPSPVGTITVAVEGKVVRLLEKTKEIMDIIDLPSPAPKRR